MNIKTCKSCNQELQPFQRNNIFCSKRCSAIYNNTNKHWRSKLQKINKRCPSCHTDFVVSSKKKQFCSLKCSNSAKNRSNVTGNKTRMDKMCLFCSLIFRGFNNSKFCSRICADKDNDKQKYLLITKGLASAVVCKTYLIKTYGNKCMECGWDKINQYTGKCPVELEHIDGNSSNNNPDNLKLLCPSCHSLTPTYKALNKGNGRHDRLKRYHDGKSY